MTACAFLVGNGDTAFYNVGLPKKFNDGKCPFFPLSVRISSLTERQMSQSGIGDLCFVFKQHTWPFNENCDYRENYQMQI